MDVVIGISLLLQLCIIVIADVPFIPVYNEYDAISCSSYKAQEQSRGQTADSWCRLYTVSFKTSPRTGRNCKCVNDKCVDTVFDNTPCVYYTASQSTRCNRSRKDQALNDFWCYTMSYSLRTGNGDPCNCYINRCYDRDNHEECVPRISFLKYSRTGHKANCNSTMDCVLNTVSQKDGLSNQCKCVRGKCMDDNDERYDCVFKPSIPDLFADKS